MVPMNDDAPCAEQLDAANAERDALKAREARAGGSMSYQINELERQLSEARTRISGLEIERDGAYSLLREAADENAALRAELDNLRGKCICNTGPGTDGPDETCPVHGRSYAEWIERGDQKQAELDSLRDRVNALADDAVFADFGQHQPFDGDDEEVVLAVRQSDLRAIVRGSDDE